VHAREASGRPKRRASRSSTRVARTSLDRQMPDNVYFKSPPLAAVGLACGTPLIATVKKMPNSWGHLYRHRLRHQTQLSEESDECNVAASCVHGFGIRGALAIAARSTTLAANVTRQLRE
jgi:hypothetical protein